MGGNALQNVSRINRTDIEPTLSWLAQHTSEFGISEQYMLENLMGSSGKQDTSGDLDIAVDWNKFPKRILYKLADKFETVLGKERVNRKTLKANQLNTAVPVFNKNSFVQVDFIYGDAEWLKFAHWSPGLDVSPWKGVFLSQAYGVLAKTKVFWRYPENAVVDKDNNIDERLAEVNYFFNLEYGLSIKARLRDKKNGTFGKVDLDTFETKAPVVPPRVPRLGYVTDPQTVLRMLVHPDVKFSDVDTFEKLVATLKRYKSTSEFEYFKHRLVNSIQRSSAKNLVTSEELLEFLNSF